ncbi:hypothetical protein TNCV_918111 [Trichonephila clavipes]|nr:hypothetical protein TNCV_918111 [Trichonephila clavipes]
MLFIKLSDPGIGSEDQTQSKTCFSSCNDLGGGFKAATSLPRYSQRLKVWRSAGHSIRSNRDPPDTPQQSELGEVVHYHPSE